MPTNDQTTPDPLAPLTALVERIDEYFALGGFWNPEMMQHDKVRTLLSDTRDELRTALAALRAAPPGLSRLETVYEKPGMPGVFVLLFQEGNRHFDVFMDAINISRLSECAGAYSVNLAAPPAAAETAVFCVACGRAEFADKRHQRDDAPPPYCALCGNGAAPKVQEPAAAETAQVYRCEACGLVSLPHICPSYPEGLPSKGSAEYPNKAGGRGGDNAPHVAQILVAESAFDGNYPTKPAAETAPQPTHGNGRCTCGHLSDLHDCDHEMASYGCTDCNCAYFHWDAKPIPAETAQRLNLEPIKARARQLHAEQGGYSVDEARRLDALIAKIEALRATRDEKPKETR